MKKFLFYFLAILGVFFMLVGFFRHGRDISFSLFSNLYADVRINIEMPKNSVENVHIFANGQELPPFIMKTKNSYISYETNNFKIYNLALYADKNAVSAIDNIVVTVGKNIYRYNKNDILKFETDKNGIYIFPKDIKYYENSKYITDKGPLKNFFCYFLSIFYNFYFYIIPFLCFILAGIIYYKNKNEISPGLGFFKKYAIWWIALLALILRLADNNFSFWSDELYTSIIAANPAKPFISTFQDPGNPPLYFILARVWISLTGLNEATCRLLPAIFSVLNVGAVYLFIKENISKGPALLCALFFAINLYSISTAQEFRCYSLCALLATLCAYYFFKIVKYKKNKDFIIYAVLSVLMANTHYFQILILLGNFLLGMFLLDKKSKLKFFFANSIGALSFLPYFFITSLNGALLNSSFNVLVKPDIPFMWNTFVKYFASAPCAVLVLAIAALLVLPKIKNRLFNGSKTAALWLYSFYTVVFLFASSYVFSLFRPIIRQYYFTNIIPFVSIILALVVFLPFKNKVFKCVVSIFILGFYFCGTDYLNRNNRILFNYEAMVRYACLDAPAFRAQNKTIGIIFRESSDYTPMYKNYLKGDEFITVCGFKVTPLIIYEAILKNPADVCYLRLEHKIYSEFVKKYSEYFNIALIRTNDDIIVARVIKKSK